jgi:hypothetical protein
VRVEQPAREAVVDGDDPGAVGQLLGPPGMLPTELTAARAS